MARGLRRHFGRKTLPWTYFRRGSATLSGGNGAGGKCAEWHEGFGDTLGGKRCLGHTFGGVRQHYRKETLPEGKGAEWHGASATLWAENVALDVLSEGFGNIIARKRCRRKRCGMARDFGDTLGGKRCLGHTFGGIRQHYRAETLPKCCRRIGEWHEDFGDTLGY